MSTQPASTGADDSAKRRRQALGGAAAGVAIVVALAVVFIAVNANKSDKPPVAAPASSAPAAAPSEALPSEAAPQGSQAPVAVKTPAALAKEPDVKAGGKQALTKVVVTPLVKGTGPVVQKGQTITANYKLVSYQTGEFLDSSWQRGQPYVTPIGVGQVIQGWDQAIPGQKVGSRLQLDVPAALGEGEQYGDLRFVVDILAVS